MRVVLDARPLQAPDRAPLTAAYLEGLLGAFDAEPLAGESFAFLLALRPRRPDRAIRSPRGRRAAPAAADAPPPLGGADRRPVPAARRRARGGLASGAGRGGRRRLPRGRRRATADRVGPAGRGHAARPRPVGAPGRVPAIGRRAGSGSACGRSICARRRRSSSGAMRRSGRPGGCSGSGGDRLRVVRLAPRPALHARPRPDASPGRLGGAARPARPARAAISSSRAGSMRARTSATLLGALAALAAAGRPAGARRRRSPGRRGSCWSAPAPTIGRRSPGRPRGKGIGEALAYAPGAGARAISPGSCAAARGGDPSGRLRGGRSARHRGDRVRHAGRRVRGRAAPRAGRHGRPPRRAARPGPSRRRPCRDLGGRPGPRPDRRSRAGTRRGEPRGRGPTSRARRGRSTPRSGSGARVTAARTVRMPGSRSGPAWRVAGREPALNVAG